MKSHNGSNIGSNHEQRHNLRRYKYLKIKPSVVRTSHLQFIFMGFTTFSIGILIGFNFKDVMAKKCCTHPTVKPTESLTAKSSAPARLVKRQEFSPNKQEVIKEANDKNPKPVFTKLPEKFLTDVRMPPPVRFYHLRPWKIIEESNQNLEKYFLMILVKTASAFTKRRFQIRLTWGSMSSIEGKKIAVMFVVGVSRTQSQQKLLEEENALYGDLVQGDVSDTYRQLPTKVLSGYQFVAEYLGNASEFFVSTDDDCFLNIPNTLQYFESLAPDKKDAIHCGYIYSWKSSRITNMKSKWGVSEEIYPIKPYPRFCHGGMTILSFNMLQGIYHMSLTTNYTGFHLEDVLTNGILREKLPNRDNNIHPILMRDPRTRRKMSLMWHLGYRKDRDEAFMGIWRGIKRRLAHYEGPFDPKAGFRSTITPMKTIEGKTIRDTILHFCPEEAKKSPKGVTIIKKLPNAVANQQKIENPNMEKQ